MSVDIKAGAVGTITNQVTEQMTASSFAENDGEAYPQVLATPYLIADMERACAQLLQPLLGEGELSVGAQIDVRHQAPTGVGGTYVSRAIFIEKAGPIYWFEVEAEDSLGTIGVGRIGRAIVKVAEVEDRGNKAALKQM